MPLKIPKPYIDTLATHRRRLARIIDRRGVVPMKKLYERAQAEIVNKLTKLGPSGQKFAVYQHRMVLGQLRQGSAMVAKRMRGEMSDLSLHAQTEALRGLSQDMARLEKFYSDADIVLSIDEAARFQGVITGRRDSLLRAHDVSMAEWSSGTVRKMEDELSLSLLEGENLGEAVTRIEGVADAEWWQAERIVRSETAHAFNATHADGIRECAGELPDLMMRWTEYVDDGTGEALDDRVSGDSVIMHGQVAPPGGMFYLPTTMPDGTSIPEKIEKRLKHLRDPGTWPCPPNRPNDRSVLAPWRAHWGIPAWRWESGARVPVLPEGA